MQGKGASSRNLEPAHVPVLCTRRSGSLIVCERKLRFLLCEVLGVAHDGKRVDAEVELVGGEAAPAAGAVLRPKDGQVGHGKVADAAQRPPVAVRRPLVPIEEHPPRPAEAARVLGVAKQVLHHALRLETDTG